MLSPSDVESIVHKMGELGFRVTAEEVLEYYEAFAEFDRDKSQNISTSELGCVMRSLGENPTSMELEVCKEWIRRYERSDESLRLTC